MEVIVVISSVLQMRRCVVPVNTTHAVTEQHTICERELAIAVHLHNAQ
jgi:hypothetical protein